MPELQAVPERSVHLTTMKVIFTECQGCGREDVEK